MAVVLAPLPPPGICTFDGRAAADIRHRLGESQAQVAARVPCSRDQIRSMENGRVTPSLPMLTKLAAALGVWPGELFRAGGDT